MIVRVARGAALLFAVVASTTTLAQAPRAADGLIGRWDLVVERGAQGAPSWLEVERSGSATLVGQFVGSGGSARPIAKIEFTDGTFRFAIPPQWESNPRDITFEGRLDGDRVTGTMTMRETVELLGTRIRRMPMRLAQALGRLTWRLGQSETPPGQIEFAMNPWICSNEKIKETLGWGEQAARKVESGNFEPA